MYTVMGYAAFYRGWDGSKQHIDLSFYMPFDTIRRAEDAAWLYTNKYGMESFVAEIRKYDNRIEDHVMIIITKVNGSVIVTK